MANTIGSGGVEEDELDDEEDDDLHADHLAHLVCLGVTTCAGCTFCLAF